MRRHISLPGATCARLGPQVGVDRGPQARTEALERLVAAHEPLDAESVDQRAHDAGRLLRVEAPAEFARGDPADDDLVLQNGAAEDEAERIRAHGGLVRGGAEEVEVDAVEVAVLARAQG